MGKHISIKSKLLELCNSSKTMFKRLENNPVLIERAIQGVMRADPAMTVKDAIQQIQDERVGFSEMEVCISRGQTIVFSAEQAEVFKSVTKDYADSLDFRLPFSYLVLQFTNPVPMSLMNRRVSGEPTTDYLLAILLRQEEITDDYIQRRDEFQKILKGNPFNLLAMPRRLSEAKGGFVNRAIAVWSDWNISRFGWLSDSSDELANDDPSTEEQSKVHVSWAGIKRLAIACIGYINCENVYLHREDIPPAINTKRERKGKSRLEPYYVCRIRGVQYDGNGETGTGSAHGIRYDVRGHFRRLTNGKTTWVRAHQRGLQNELYVPKTYVVNKGAKGA